MASSNTRMPPWTRARRKELFVRATRPMKLKRRSMSLLPNTLGRRNNNESSGDPGEGAGRGSTSNNISHCEF
ncbi:hypothetical protein FIBSPDRAFT_876126 [Athelia psychrophila]|uniref:Uncharacterized protein n=1 Tax=Athelia psychrophila TaxID=1759441 RepID=A0A167X657_9AGAM|nr:hypothetical protein FIBSPDRAFT_876126 [Fibularhizoctonia sp. CBS 109695]